MKGSLTILGIFLAGILIGLTRIIPEEWCSGGTMTWVLYILIFQVGIGIGVRKDLKQILQSIRPRFLLLPVCTVTGTIIASYLVSFLITRWNASECIAVGCGLGYYSLSSVLISELKTASIGAQAAAELGTLALLTNIVREMIALLGSPLLVRFFGRFAPVNAAGVTSMDTVLPVIIRCSGPEIIPLSLLHGLALEVSIPFLVSFFCKI